MQQLALNMTTQLSKDMKAFIAGIRAGKTTQEGQLLVLSSRKRVRIFTETIELSPVCSAASSVAKSVLWGRPTHSSVSARVPLFHMSLQVASAEALRVCAPRYPAGTLGDRSRARVAVGWPLLVKEEVGGHFSACWGGERSAVCHS